ncbi:1-deoxy-D-xylulose-5-phosphate synthase [Actinospongicola halichondriae]|uniref:1-deoxy-D-xylulose-5-phosphate synthase n=1 Tax=Actinospongicola halichondriae TaxID=3236844 RepID=UPI003D370DC7
MLLDRINSPADLRGLSHAQLGDLAVEIRAFIVDAIDASPAGGHLGSNLGAVELTLAVHRVFESPRDIVLWDTGHQAYVHKLITGRRETFDTLRQEGGLSGYPSRSESPHDWVENSHASTIVSYAHGLATAMDRNEITDRRIVAVIGDGSLTGGMAYEGLNNLGNSGSNAIIILNDNGRSYAPTASRLGDSLARIRLDPRYLRNKARFEKLLREVPLLGDRLERGFEATLAGLRDYFEPPAFFEDLGIRYTGPFDGHDVEGLESALRDAHEYEGPIVVHVLTQKGRGYAPAENDSIKHMHDMGSVKPGYCAAAFSEALIKEADVRPEVVAITAAMPDSTGLLPFAERFPDRVFDVGIAEQHAVTSAAGMAMGGLRPVIAVYSTFMSRAFDQVNLDVGLHDQPVVFCIDRAGITGNDGASHHGVLDMVLFTKVPNMTVLAPSSYEEIGVMLHDALDISDGPVMIRWPKTLPSRPAEDEVGSGLRGRKARDGSDLCILAVGKMLEASLEAADTLAAEGIEATVWDVRSVKPLDPAMIADAAGHALVLTVEDGYRNGGAGSLITTEITDACTDSATPRVETLGIPTTYIEHAGVDDILHRFGLDAEGIAGSARRAHAAHARSLS